MKFESSTTVYVYVYCKDRYNKNCDYNNNFYISNSHKKYYRGYLVHREDGPAIENIWGGKKWYKDGELHREDGPAIELSNGTKELYINGKLHRVDGHAVELFDGKKLWYLNGKEYKEEEYNKIMNLKKKYEVLSEI